MPFRPSSRTRLAAAALFGLAGCVGSRTDAPATGPFHLAYDGPQRTAHAALTETIGAAHFAVARDDADLGLVRTAPRPLLPEERPAGAAAPPDTAEVWFRLAERPDGRTLLAARPLLAVTVPRSPEDPASARVPLLADLPPSHPLSRHVLGRLLAAGFTVVPAGTTALRGVDLSTEVYDDQP